MTDATLLQEPSLLMTSSDNPDEVAHIVNQHLPGNSIADATIFGTEVTALCGHKYIPTKDPYKLPVCKACKAILEATP